MKNVYLNEKSEAFRYYCYGLIFKEKEHKTINHEGKLYTYFGKASNWEKDSSYIFKARCAYIAEICLAILSLGLLMLSKSYRKLLSHHKQDLKNGIELVKIYYLKTDASNNNIPIPQRAQVPQQAQGGPLAQNGSVLELKTMRLPNPESDTSFWQFREFFDTSAKDIILVNSYTDEEIRAYQEEINALLNKVKLYQYAFDNLSFENRKRLIFNILSETRSVATLEVATKIETLLEFLKDYPKDGVLRKEVLDLGKEILEYTKAHFDQYIYILNKKNLLQNQALKFLSIPKNLLQEIVSLNKQEEFIKKADMNLIKTSISEALERGDNWETQLDNFPKIKEELIKQNKWDEISSYFGGSLIGAANLRMRNNSAN